MFFPFPLNCKIDPNPNLSNLPLPAYFHQAIAESGSALSGWAFDSTPESHAHEIASTHLGCPTDSTAALVSCSYMLSAIRQEFQHMSSVTRFSKTWFTPSGQLSEEWEDFPGHCPWPWKICGKQIHTCGYVDADADVDVWKRKSGPLYLCAWCFLLLLELESFV